MKSYTLFSFLLLGAMAMSSTAANAGATRLYADPTSGKAPLSVEFTIAGGRGNYSLDFGDGTVVGPAICMEGANCPEKYSISHDYKSAGEFTVTLVRSADEFKIGSIKISVIQ